MSRRGTHTFDRFVERYCSTKQFQLIENWFYIEYYIEIANINVLKLERDIKHKSLSIKKFNFFFLLGELEKNCFFKTI